MAPTLREAPDLDGAVQGGTGNDGVCAHAHAQRSHRQGVLRPALVWPQGRNRSSPLCAQACANHAGIGRGTSSAQPLQQYAPKHGQGLMLQSKTS